MSSFGTLFRVTTFGESHCKGVGAIVDGVPSRMALTEADIQPQLTRRRPGQSRLTTPRDEKDKCTIICGVERGYTLGTPIAISVPNNNVRPGDYLEMLNVPRPGHADYTYQVKYGTRAASGGAPRGAGRFGSRPRARGASRAPPPPPSPRSAVDRRLFRRRRRAARTHP